jgi:hypothetical protein
VHTFSRILWWFDKQNQMGPCPSSPRQKPRSLKKFLLSLSGLAGANYPVTNE